MKMLKKEGGRIVNVFLHDVTWFSQMRKGILFLLEKEIEESTEKDKE